MSVSTVVQNCIIQQGIHFDVIEHASTDDSMHTAAAARIPGDQLAKSVVLKDEFGFVMAVVPATHRVDLGALSRQVNRRLGLATETELAPFFTGCQPGAVPPLGSAFGMETILDESLAGCEDIYFEAGDHRNLVHVQGMEFLLLMAGSRRGRFSHRV